MSRLKDGDIVPPGVFIRFIKEPTVYHSPAPGLIWISSDRAPQNWGDICIKFNADAEMLSSRLEWTLMGGL